MKKIFFLIPTLSTGGGERVVSELSKEFSKRAKVSVIVFSNQVSYTYGGKLISLDIILGGNFFVKIYRYLKALARFKILVWQEKPDYVISFGHIANIVNILSGAKAIVRADNFFSSSLPGFGGAIYKALIKWLFKKAYLVVAVSKASREDLVKNFNVPEVRVKVIYNPLNVEEIRLLTQEPLEQYQDIFTNPVVVTMGRLNIQKGQWHLLKAFKIVKEKIKDAKLVILGDGELKEKLQEFAGTLGIAYDVHFLGWQKNPFKFLGKANVFALSSLWEGLPYVILEAMASGLPVVSVDCKSGPTEILGENGEYGVLVSSDNIKDFNFTESPYTKSEEALARELIRLLDNPKIQASYRELSQQRAEDFKIEDVTKEWDFLFDK